MLLASRFEPRANLPDFFSTNVVHNLFLHPWRSPWTRDRFALRSTVTLHTFPSPGQGVTKSTLTVAQQSTLLSSWTHKPRLRIQAPEESPEIPGH